MKIFRFSIRTHVKELCLWKSTLHYSKTINCCAHSSLQRRWKCWALSGLDLMKFTVLTTSSTPLRSPLSCCKASASQWIRYWVHFALTATPCTDIRRPPKRPDIAWAPSVHKPTPYFHSRLFSWNKLFSIANNSCALQFVKMGLQKSNASMMLSLSIKRT